MTDYTPTGKCEHVWHVEQSAWKEWRWCARCFTEQERGVPAQLWTDEEVTNINDFQRSGAYHPFTCDCPHPERNYRLVAYNDGLRCEHCGWHQTWVHPFMADGSALRAHRETVAKIFGEAL